MKLGLDYVQTMDLCCPTCGKGRGSDRYATQETTEAASLHANMNPTHEQIERARTVECPECGRTVLASTLNERK